MSYKMIVTADTSKAIKQFERLGRYMDIRDVLARHPVRIADNGTTYRHDPAAMSATFTKMFGKGWAEIVEPYL